MIRCTVGNSGSFIESSDIERIFDPFFTKGKQNGNGLGFAIAKKAVTDHKGDIQCKSSAERNSVEFLFTLPLAKLSKPIQTTLPANSKEVVQKLRAMNSVSSVISDPNEADLLICDVDLGLSSINGFALVKQLRTEKYTFPICMHSNRCLHEDYQKAFEVGAQSFLP